MAQHYSVGPSGSGLPDPPPLSPNAAAPALPGPPPPTYAPTQPQILVMPLPEAPSFFWGRTIQGEVYVKGLGEDRTQAVRSLTVTARLTDRATGMPDLNLGSFPTHTLYPPTANGSHDASTSLATPSGFSATPFPTSHRFALDLPPGLPNGSPLPGSLDLGLDNALRWTLEVRLTLSSGDVVTEVLRLEGVPPELDVGDDDESSEAVARLDRAGVSVRLVLGCTTPRLGDSLHIGVEVCPSRRERTGLAGLVAQPDPNDVLRPLRRVRVELVRLVDVASPPESSAAAAIGGVNTLSTTVHASGKSLRYPGSVGRHPPLRVLFALPTAQLHPGMLGTGGEISARTPYHDIRFVVRATLGFGVSHDNSQPPVAPGLPDVERSGWTVEQEISVRPPAWREPSTVVIEGGMAPAPGIGGAGMSPGSISADDVLMPPPEEDSVAAREAYRRKGRDVVGSSGTTRAPEPSYGQGPADAPPPFLDAGPSGTHSADMDTNTDSDSDTSIEEVAAEPSGLPSFNESEAQMRSGAAPRLARAPESERLQPVSFENEFEAARTPRRPSLRGELASWTEYDGYETFSMAPPPVAASFGVEGIMDPPPGDDAPDATVAGDIAARLGLGGAPSDPAQLMEQLGLSHGRIVDLQDDLPPGIDEPSLPALPGFGQGGVTGGLGLGVSAGGAGRGMPQHNTTQVHAAHTQYDNPPRFMDPFNPAPPTENLNRGAHNRSGHGHHSVEVDHPPSFDASEAAEAVGGVARSRVGSVRLAGLPNLNMNLAIEGDAHHPPEGDAPPGYFGGGPPAYGS